MGRAKAPTVSNNGEDSIELGKKKKSRRAWSSTNMETSQLSARRANFVLHCCSDNNHNGQKSWPPRFRNSIFAKHSESPPTTGPDPCGDLDGVLELTLVCRVHILEPYIHTYENMTWGFMPLARDFPPGLPGLACGGGAPQPCALSWKCICTIFYFERVESVFAQFGGDRRWKNAFNPFRHLFVFTEAA